MNKIYNYLLLLMFIQFGFSQVESELPNDTVTNEEQTPRNSTRMLILITLEDEHPQLTKQIDIINAHRKEAIERKISIIQATPKGVKPIFNSNKNMSRVGMSFREMKRGNSDFELVLVGLDGTIKLRKSLAIEADELFSIIDDMPIRRSEMR